MQTHELAQLNIASMKEPLESPSMADFVANLDRINALAEASDGFVWRLQTDEGDATAVRPLGAQTLVNVSVWRDVAALKDYVYTTAHAQIMRRRQEWFDRMGETSLVLWWVPLGHRPGIDEAMEKLTLLRSVGPSAQAFNFKQSFAPPQAVLEPKVGVASAPLGAKVKGPASYFPSIEKTYGMPITHWLAVLEGLGQRKHMEYVAHLKSEYQLGHGHANALVAHFLAR
jgi:hypothetical protein